MNRFILSTVKSLYAPLEIEIDEKVYRSIKLTHPVMLELDKLEQEIAKKNKKALYEWVSFMFDIDKAILEKLDVREVEDVYLYASAKFRESEIERRDRELGAIEKQIKRLGLEKEPDTPKNVKRPGRKKSL